MAILSRTLYSDTVQVPRRAAFTPKVRIPQISLAHHYTLWCNDVVDDLTDVMTALSHPTRRAIIEQLAHGPATFLDIARHFETALNAVSKHLKLLERAGLIRRRKQGREVHISLCGEPLKEVARWVHVYEHFWNQRLDEFEQHFKQEKGAKTTK